MQLKPNGCFERLRRGADKSGFVKTSTQPDDQRNICHQGCKGLADTEDLPLDGVASNRPLGTPLRQDRTDPNPSGFGHCGERRFCTQSYRMLDQGWVQVLDMQGKVLGACRGAGSHDHLKLAPQANALQWEAALGWRFGRSRKRVTDLDRQALAAFGPARVDNRTPTAAFHAN